MEFNERLQKLRTGKNLTQEELAQKLYVSRSAISKWESGRGYPSIDSLKAIARFFHVTLDELIGSEETVRLAEEDLQNTRKQY
ncbi:MAG: helix-turn-helix transcriptional regulator, partial [Clostridiaceae bacterium]|nr:helix-turn-helix transcriptional regulator [Clostridiaceae bacterium]